MTIRKLFVSIALLSAVTTAYAIPAKPIKKTVLTNDGKSIELTLHGDEHYSYYTDENGQCYLLRADGVAVRTSSEIVTETWTARKQERLKFVKPRLAAMQGSQRRAGTASAATTGKHRGLVILMEFQDVKFTTANANAVYQEFFNKEGYTDYGMCGSVRDYFLKQSYGQLEIDFDVVGPYTTKNNMEYYGGPAYDGYGNVESHDRNPFGMVAEGVDAASAEVDFRNYDWDEDGEVDQVFVIYAGYAQAQGGHQNTIWPHEWVLEAGGLDKIYNGVKINTYGCASELRGASGTSLDGIGSACHEFSHCLGLPDMYDTSESGSSYGMKNWDVMCSGNYNDNSCTPAGYTAYERWFSGWMEPTEINSMTRINDMKPLATDPEAYILYNNGNRNEYYLLENRQPVGFDAKLSGHGLLIVHVDYDKNAWVSNSVNYFPNHQRMTVIPADNNFSYYGIAGDAWPGTSGNTTLTNYTTPAAEVYNFNTDGTKFMSKNIDNITENTTNNTVSFVVCRPELGIPDIDNSTTSVNDNAFTLTWPKVNGAVGYEVELTEVGSAATTPSEALVREFDFSSFYSSSASFVDSSSKMGNMGLNGWNGSKLYTSPQKMKIGTTGATGYVMTPTWDVPQSSDMTIVMGAETGKAGTTVKGTLRVAFGNVGDMPSYEDIEFTVAQNEKQVFHFSIMKERFWIEIRPDAMMYLNYLAIYDGQWSAEQLNAGSSAPAIRRASTVSTYTTTTNSYTFTGLNKANRFIYRVRTIGEENTYSQWSKNKTFSFDPTAISEVVTDKHEPIRYFDLSGREVDASAHGVLIMKQGNKTRKVVR